MVYFVQIHVGKLLEMCGIGLFLVIQKYVIGWWWTVNVLVNVTIMIPIMGVSKQ